VAGPGYDGPTGVGTPDGITAFKPVSEAVRRANEEKRAAAKKLSEEERQREEKKKEEEAKKKAEEAATKNPEGSSTTETSTTGAGGISPANGANSDSSGTTTLSIAAGAPDIKLTAFALTPSALISLNRVRPKVADVGFVFTLSTAARVRVSIAKRVRVRGVEQWVLIPGSVTFTATRGRNRRHLSSSNGLTPGSYRLTLTPEHGSARSITFQIG
jgi:hypothetical protein